MEDYSAYFYQKYLETEKFVSLKRIGTWVEAIVHLLFPIDEDIQFKDKTVFKQHLNELETALSGILKSDKSIFPERVTKDFFEHLPTIRNILQTDIEAIYKGDPAAKNEAEVVRCYPGVFAITVYRIAHLLHHFHVKTIPRMLTEYAHGKTGIDIHPEAKIDDHFFIDHGTGVVIGATAIIGKHVKIYQGVTLGGLSVRKADADIKRHPTIEDHVVIYAGATILGGKTVIGAHSIIGGNTFITRSVPPHSKIYHSPTNTIK